MNGRKEKYGKYAALAKMYLEERAPAKLWGMAGEVAEYLHGVDRAAEELSERLYGQLSRKEEYRRTGNYMEDVRRENEMKQIIEEEILSELVYVD